MEIVYKVWIWLALYISCYCLTNGLLTFFLYLQMEDKTATLLTRITVSISFGLANLLYILY